MVIVDELTYAAGLDNLSSVSENPKYHFEHADISNTNALNANL